MEIKISDPRTNFPNRKNTKFIYGFTLIELIVVITILAILGAIGFISLMGIQKNARDSKRISSVALILKGFNINTAADKVINTSETATGANIVITGSWFTMTGYHGGLNQSLLSSLSVSSNDLLNYDGYPYKYSYFPNEKKYQVLASLESSANVPIAMEFLYDLAYADSSTIVYVYINGNFTATWGINSLMPNPDIWNAAVVENNARTIAGTGTLQIGNGVSQTANTISAEPSAGCIVDTSVIDSCNIL